MSLFAPLTGGPTRQPSSSSHLPSRPRPSLQRHPSTLAYRRSLLIGGRPWALLLVHVASRQWPAFGRADTTWELSLLPRGHLAAPSLQSVNKPSELARMLRRPWRQRIELQRVRLRAHPVAAARMLPQQLLLERKSTVPPHVTLAPSSVGGHGGNELSRES